MSHTSHVWPQGHESIKLPRSLVERKRDTKLSFDGPVINWSSSTGMLDRLAVLCRFTSSLLSWRKNWTCPSRYQNIRVSSSANHFVCWLFVLFCNYFVSFPISSHDYLVEAKPPNWTWLVSVRREVTDQTHDQPVIVLLQYPKRLAFLIL